MYDPLGSMGREFDAWVAGLQESVTQALSGTTSLISSVAPYALFAGAVLATLFVLRKFVQRRI